MTRAELLFSKHRGGNLMLDSNLLLLLIVGRFDRTRVESFKRTSNFTVAEFDLLDAFVSQFTSLRATPHILTEVSNLANSLPEYLKPGWSVTFADHFFNLDEKLVPAQVVAQETAFPYFGLADAALQQSCAGCLLLTEDSRLAAYIAARGADVLSFRELLIEGDTYPYA